MKTPTGFYNLGFAYRPSTKRRNLDNDVILSEKSDNEAENSSRNKFETFRPRKAKIDWSMFAIKDSDEFLFHCNITTFA